MYIPVPYFKNIPQIGDLEIDNIFLENGFPVLFTCKNKEKLYLCVCRTVTDEQKWVISEINFNTLNDLIKNKCTIYDALKHNNGVSCIAKWKKGFKHEEYTVLIGDLVSDDELPEKNIYLDDDGDSDDYLLMVKNRLDNILIEKLNSYIKTEKSLFPFLKHISYRESIDNSSFEFEHTNITYTTEGNLIINNTSVQENEAIYNSSDSVVLNTQTINIAA